MYCIYIYIYTRTSLALAVPVNVFLELTADLPLRRLVLDERVLEQLLGART